MAEFDVSVRLLALDGSLIFDLSDQDAGYIVVDQTPADETMEFGESESPFVNGTSENWGRDAAGSYAVLLRIVGSSWAQVEARRLALREAYRSQSHFLLELATEGVTIRYRARRPDASFGTLRAENHKNNYRRVLLTFPVQPNPTVTTGV